MAKTKRVRWADAIPATVCLLVAAALFLTQCAKSGGETVRVKTPSGDTRLSLTGDYEREFVGKDGHRLTVVVANGAVSVKRSTCPDQVCVQTGALSKAGACAACVPAGIVVTVEGDDAPDVVVR